MVTLSNPRLLAVIEDYPLGREKRGTATFRVEDGGKKGQRVSRTTFGKPKYTTYAERCAIVDGSDGRTYVLTYSSQYGESVRVVCSDLQHDAAEALGRPSAYVRPEDGEIFALLKSLLDAAQAVPQ